MLEPATQKDVRESATDIRVRVSRSSARTLKRIAAMKRWKQKTVVEASIDHFAKSLGISVGRRASQPVCDSS